MNWFHRLFNPHCEHCLSERREQRDEIRSEHVCESCETLKRQLEIRNHEYDLLLHRLIDAPSTPQVQEAPPININRPKTVPWNIRRQMLEAEDRKKAQLMSQAPKPTSSPVVTEDVADLERELDVVEQEREVKTNV